MVGFNAFFGNAFETLKAMPILSGMDIFTNLGPSAIGRIVGIKPSSVIDWRKRGIPADRCAELERGTQGAYTCEGLRPDVRWVRVADSDWPWHPEGRPCVDVASALPPPAERPQKPLPWAA